MTHENKTSLTEAHTALLRAALSELKRGMQRASKLSQDASPDIRQFIRIPMQSLHQLQEHMLCARAIVESVEKDLRVE